MGSDHSVGCDRQETRCMYVHNIRMFLRKFKPFCLSRTYPIMFKFVLSIMTHRLYVFKADLR